MSNPRWNHQTANKRGGKSKGWKTGGIEVYPGSGKNGVGDYDQHNSANKAGAYDKVATVMSEFKHGTLHSGSKKGPKVKSRKQAIAIGMSESRKQAEGKY